MIICNDNNFNFDFNLEVVFKKILKETLKQTKLKIKEFYVNFTSIDEIKLINKKYRNKDNATDVISFRFDDNGLFNPIQGEIYICIDIAIKQANEYHHSLKREICFLFLHGVLHLLGYDHLSKDDEEVMFGLQEIILNKLDITR